MVAPFAIFSLRLVQSQPMVCRPRPVIDGLAGRSQRVLLPAGR